MRYFGWLAAMIVAGPALAQTGPAAGGSDAMREAAREIATSYLDVWSASNAAAVADVPFVYAPRVQFYGRTMSQAALIAEKRRFTKRWPQRRYSHRPGSMRIDCNARSQACHVVSTMDWEARDPSRGALSRGASRFELGIAFGGRQPVILYESGRVLGRAG